MQPLHKIAIALWLLMNAINVATAEELLELTCHDANQCEQFHTKSVEVQCIEGHCQCSRTAGWRIKCEPKEVKLNNIVGGHCPCTMPHSRCNDREEICYCQAGYAPSLDMRRCLAKEVELGEECEFNGQCQAVDTYAECKLQHKSVQGICECKEGFIKSNGQCVSIVGRNAQCTNDVECALYGALAKCSESDNRCFCPDGYVSTQNKIECLEISEYHKKCTEHTQCQKNLGAGAACMEGVCRCDEKHYPMEFHPEDNESLRMICKHIAERGDYCTTHEDCYQHQLSELEQTMDCFYGTCNCKWNFKSTDDDTCHKGVSSSLKQSANPSFLFGIIFFALITLILI